MAFPKNVIRYTLHRLTGLLGPGRKNTNDTTVTDNWASQQWYSTASIRTLHPPPRYQNHPHQTLLHGLTRTPSQQEQEGSLDHGYIKETSHLLHERVHGITKMVRFACGHVFSLPWDVQFFPGTSIMFLPASQAIPLPMLVDI